MTIGLVTLAAAPLAAALFAVALPRRAPWGAWIAVVAVVTALVALWRTLHAQGEARLALGGWDAPLGIVLAVDGLGLGFMVLSALVMTALTAVSARAFDPKGTPGPATFGFWPLAMLLWAALNAIFLSRDLFNLYVGLELLALAAVALVTIKGEARTLAAALRYLFFALMGSLLYLLGVVLVYAAHGTLDIALLSERPHGGEAERLALGLMTAGLCVKTALFPFHVWLPAAHAGAPAPASAMLSALVPKASFFILMRLWFEALHGAGGDAALALLAGLGAAAVVHGGVMALRQNRLKLIIAYSTVAQIGYLFLVFPLAGGEGAAQPWAAGAWAAAVYHALSHGFAKAAMFLCAGLWMAALGHDKLTGLRGLVTSAPVSVFAFALAAVTLVGLPPSGGFTAKYLMMTSAFASGQLVWVVVLVIGGLLSAAYLYRPIAHLFSRASSDRSLAVPRALQYVPLVLACIAIGLGIFSHASLETLKIGRPETAEEGL